MCFQGTQENHNKQNFWSQVVCQSQVVCKFSTGETNKEITHCPHQSQEVLTPEHTVPIKATCRACLSIARGTSWFLFPFAALTT